MLAGPSGVGKTLLALHFVYAGAQNGEPGLIATLQENPVQLERILRGFSWSLDDPRVELMYRTPVDLYLDEWVYDLLDTIERTGATKTPSTASAISAPPPATSCGSANTSTRSCNAAPAPSASVMMTQEVPELFGITRLSEYGISHLCDNVVLLQYLAEIRS